MKKSMFAIIVLLTALTGTVSAHGYETVKTYNCPDATQGVATDGKYFFAIGTKSFAKYTVQGDSIATWKEARPEFIHHFDGGIVIDGLLYLSHSNFPQVPMASSIEVFDPETLTHVKTISLGIDNGSCTWVVRGDGCWYVCFAHYDRNGGTAGGEVLKNNSWTQIVRYDDDWHRTAGWTVPGELLEQLSPNSLSGGLYVDGRFYCTGHDAQKLFILEFPPVGMCMKLAGTIDIPFKGQGIALDSDGNLWGIDRKKKTVMMARSESPLKPSEFTRTWAKGPQWLENAVIYQVYPSSFKDSDGNGIGDIPGVMSELDYIESLGVSAIWFNPLFESGWIDGGYDIKDYYKVDPRFGTNSDLVALIDECHRRGIRVLLDLVPGHTSMNHPWFRQSMEADANQQYSNYYIWSDRLPSASDEEKLKTMLASENPLQNTIGKWMQADAPRAKYYMKNYYACQPSLNFGYANPKPGNPWEQGVDEPGPQAVKQELKNILAFWYSKGVDGFRVDMANSLIKRDPDKKGISAFWREIRGWMDENYPGRVLMAEWGDPAHCLKAGFNVDMYLNGIRSTIRQMYFDRKHQAEGGSYFSLDACAPSTKDLYGNAWPEDQINRTDTPAGILRQYYDSYMDYVKGTGDYGYYAMITGNHDHLRFNTGPRNNPAQLKVMMAWIMTQQLPILYYGDEIGIRSLVDLPSVEGSNHNGKERSGGRTPMQWDSSENAGFSTCAPDKLYLPVCPEWTPAYSYPEYLKWKAAGCKSPAAGGSITVESQDKDPESLLNWTRALISLRKDNPAFWADSSWEPYFSETDPYPMVYSRSNGEETFIIALNPTGRTCKVEIPCRTEGAETALSQGKASMKPSRKGTLVEMGATSVIIVKL